MLLPSCGGDAREARARQGEASREGERGGRSRYFPVSLRLSLIPVYLHTKFLASSVLPLPRYVATCGYGHSGRVRTTFPRSTRDAITSFAACPASTQRRMTPSISNVSVPVPPLHSIMPGTM